MRTTSLESIDRRRFQVSTKESPGRNVRIVRGIAVAVVAWGPCGDQRGRGEKDKRKLWGWG
jgi:hypothetical protein